MRKQASFSTAESNGYRLFKQNCNGCHTEPLFTNGTFQNNGLPIDTTLNDFGRIKVSNLAADSLCFKVPTLRNIQYSYPYMHDGRFKSLTQVILHYNHLENNGLLPKELNKPMNLNDHDRVDLVAFLKTLSDPEFLFTPQFGPPKT